MKWYWAILVVLLGSLVVGLTAAVLEEWMEKNDWL